MKWSRLVTGKNMKIDLLLIPDRILIVLIDSPVQPANGGDMPFRLHIEAFFI
jgi:hypothetical protein